MQVVQDGLLQGGVGLDRVDQNGEVSLKLVYQIRNYGVVLGEVSFSGDKYLEVVGDKRQGREARRGGREGIECGCGWVRT